MRLPDRYDLLDLPFLVVAYTLMDHFGVPMWACVLVAVIFAAAFAADEVGRDWRRAKAEGR